MTITFTTGLMGSGKSRNLIKIYKKDKTKKVCFAAHLTNHTGRIGLVESRNGESIYAINLNKDKEDLTEKFLELFVSLTKVETVYIDESQFLSSSTIESIIRLSKEYSFDVHFYGLLTTFTDDLFESSEYLLKKIDQGDIIPLMQFCKMENCGQIAYHNARIIDDRVCREGKTFVEEKSTYLPLCSKHYFE